MTESDTALQTKDLSRRMLVAVITPLLLLLAMAILLGLQLSRMSEDARWVEHSDEVLVQIGKVQREVIDQETGMRGFVITGERIFLEPYEKANPTYSLAVLRRLVADSPQQVLRVDALRQHYDVWHTATAQIISTGKIPTTADGRLTRKAQMDAVRGAIDELEGAERDIRHRRSAAAEQSGRATRIELIILVLAAAAVLAFLSRRQLGAIAGTYAHVLAAERLARSSFENEAWLRQGKAHLAERVQGQVSVTQLGEQALQALGKYVGADVGAFFIAAPAGWQRIAGFGFDPRSAGAATFAKTEGLIGRAGGQKEPLHLKEVPADYLVVHSGTGQRAPVEVVFFPATSDGTTHAVVELGFLRPIDPRALELLRRIGETLGLAVNSTVYKERLRDLLEESQRQAEELQTQQEELRVMNEELAEQTSALREANEQSALRQTQLEQINTQLEEQAEKLRIAQQAVSEKAAEAERASRYKSEFLANMSHELRTPLNSSLILAKLLADNPHGNLTAEQVRFAETIYAAGNDLLTLINDILDLSKIEAGKVEVRPSTVQLGRLCDTLKRTFEPMARERRLTFAITVAAETPPTLETDAQWLEQILRNLIANALKFTTQGEVALRVHGAGEQLHFAVRDTGIGIAKHQQEMIFEAFRQADGTTNRKYGGTGLGLSISRDLTRLLGGQLTVDSEVGQGSTFTLILPRRLNIPASATSPRPAPTLRTTPAKPALVTGNTVAPAPAPRRVVSNHDVTLSGRRILIVEDDVRNIFALSSVLESRGATLVIARNGREALTALDKNQDVALVLMDLMMPEMDGIEATREIRKQPRWAKLPIIALTAKAMADDQQRCREAGMNDYLAKPLDIEALLRLLQVWLPR